MSFFKYFNSSILLLLRFICRKKYKTEYTPDLLEIILNGIPDVVGVYNTDHTIISFNQAGYNFYNVTPDQIKGKKCYQMLFREQKCSDCPVDRAISSKRIVRKEKYLSYLDKYMDYCCNPVLDESGKVMFVVELLRDISDKNRLDTLLKQSGKNYRKIVNLSPDAIVITVNGIVELANQQALQFLDRPIGEKFEKYIVPDYRMPIRKGKEYVLNNNANKFLLDCKMFRNDGSTADIEISTSYFNYKGKDALLLLMRDISERNKEINNAAKYQLMDFQKPFPLPDKVQMESLYVPAKGISGDFYYFYKVEDNVVIGLLGDFSGKSFKAAMGISAFNVLFHEAVLETHDTVEILRIINKKASFYFEENYIAAVCFSFDFGCNKANIAGAGINQFIFQKNNQEACVKTVKGSYLGMFENSEFEQKTLAFDAGDRFCFFSDGLDYTILKSKVRERFVMEKSIDELKNHIKDDMKDMMSEVNCFKDDCTLLLLEMR